MWPRLTVASLPVATARAVSCPVLGPSVELLEVPRVQAQSLARPSSWGCQRADGGSGLGHISPSPHTGIVGQKAHPTRSDPDHQLLGKGLLKGGHSCVTMKRWCLGRGP